MQPEPLNYVCVGDPYPSGCYVHAGELAAILRRLDELELAAQVAELAAWLDGLTPRLCLE